MRKPLKTRELISAFLIISLLYFSGYLHTFVQAQQKNIPIIKKEPKPSPDGIEKFFDTQRQPQDIDEAKLSKDNQKALRKLAGRYRDENKKSEFDAIAQNITKMLVNPFKGSRSIIDALKPIIRYHTGGGQHPIGIKIDI